MPPSRELRVFVNCPFDDKYIPIFHAIIFAIHDLGFQARHALIDNTAALRARRIYEELEGSLYSIHELGQVSLSAKSRLPRFNMPSRQGSPTRCTRAVSVVARRITCCCWTRRRIGSRSR